MSVFETETMAELCVKQGLVTEALAIYRRLVAGAPDEETRRRRAARLGELERTAAGAARIRSDGDVARYRSHTPGPPSLRPAEPGSARAESEALLELERRGDSLTFTWALPEDTRGAALQLFFVRRGDEGVVTETRTVPVDAPRGALTLAVPRLHSVRAAVGWLDGDRFVPLARIS